jgi:hypothetical protein
LAGGIRKIAALEKRAGGAGNRHGGDLDMRLTNLKPRMNHELEPCCIAQIAAAYFQRAGRPD